MDEKQTPETLTGLLHQVRTATGLSRSHLATLLGVPDARLRRWESGQMKEFSNDAERIILALEAAYLDACDWLKEADLTWEDVCSRRDAAMRMGISARGLDRKVKLTSQGKYIDFGMLDLWLEYGQVTQCQVL
jgi:DNA-binding XRE family transcriptional regulator